MTKKFIPFLILIILVISCFSTLKNEKIGYLGKTKEEIVKEKGNPVEIEKDMLISDEIIAYGEDLLNYEVFYFKNDLCFQHNQTYSIEKFDKKYEELKKQFGEPVKQEDSFFFADNLITLIVVNKKDSEKITKDKLVFNGAGEKDTFTIIWGDIHRKFF